MIPSKILPFRNVQSHQFLRSNKLKQPSNGLILKALKRRLDIPKQAMYIMRKNLENAIKSL